LSGKRRKGKEKAPVIPNYNNNRKSEGATPVHHKFLSTIYVEHSTVSEKTTLKEEEDAAVPVPRNPVENINTAQQKMVGTTEKGRTASISDSVATAERGGIITMPDSVPVSTAAKGGTITISDSGSFGTAEKGGTITTGISDSSSFCTAEKGGTTTISDSDSFSTAEEGGTVTKSDSDNVTMRTCDASGCAGLPEAVERGHQGDAATHTQEWERGHGGAVNLINPGSETSCRSTDKITVSLIQARFSYTYHN
jgi:hypothetical protein